MGMFDSIKNQIGRDIGKSISNVVLKDAHATPVRMTNRSSNNKSKAKALSEYEKRLKQIDISQTPKTIIRKLGAVLVEFESDVNLYLSDNFIDLKEEIELAKRFYEILVVFSKIEKQFKINDDDTTKLMEIYLQNFQRPMLKCINQLKGQETDSLLADKYEQLHNELKSIVKNDNLG